MMDAQILLWFQNIRTPMLNSFFLTISNLVWIISAASLAMCCFKKTRKAGMYIFLSIVLCGVINTFGLKLLFMRERPFLAVDLLERVGPIPNGSSFPSSHTTFAFALAWMVFWMRKKKWILPAFGYAILVGISRMYLGVHYPSDVIAGVVVAAIFSFLLYKGLERASN